MDIVYPVKSTNENIELRYSLRSLQNIQHDRVFIIGDLPNFVQNVIYIPIKSVNSRYVSTTNSLKTICINKEVSDNFIWMNDDFFILKPIQPNDLLLNRGKMNDIVSYYHKIHNSLTPYDRNVENAYKELKSMGFEEPISFELHCPIIINKYKFLTICDKIKTDALHCCKRSLYGNYYIGNSNTIKDIKVLSNTIFDEKNYDRFISCSENTFKKVEDFLKKNFPNKCIYEK